MKLMKRATALLLSFLMLTNGPISAFATEGASDNDIVVETAITTETVASCEECGGSDAHAETCSLNTINLMNQNDTMVCTVCGAENCETTHVYCDTCEKYDCGLTHATCDKCGTVDCQSTHEAWCDTCKKDSCGVDHTTSSVDTGSAVDGEAAGCTECGATEGHTTECSQYVDPNACAECKQVDVHAETCSLNVISCEECGQTKVHTEECSSYICEECGEHIHTPDCSKYIESRSIDTLMAELLICEDVEQMYMLILDVMGNEPELLYEFTYSQLETLKNLAYSLNDAAPSADYEDLLDTLLYLQGELDMNGAVTLPVGNDINGNKVYFASVDNAEKLFTGESRTDNVTYDSKEDALVFRKNEKVSDPMVTFDVSADNLSTNDYPYIAITYKTTTSGENSQLFLLTSNHPLAAIDAQPRYSLTGDGKYHTVIIDASEYECWTNDTIKGFRFDYFGTGNVGDTLYIDSIAFCADLDHANYMKWERETLRGSAHAEFYAAPGMDLSFSGNHNVVASYDLEKDAVKLVVENTGCVSCGSTSGHTKPNTTANWGQPGNDDAFDPQIVFNIPGGVTDLYKYVVITYMCEDMYLDGRYIPGENAGGDDWYDDTKYPTQDKIPINVGLFPETKNGGYNKDYERNVALLDENVYYSVYIPLSDELQGEETKTIRFDPFNCHFAEEGATLYLASVIFCNTLEEAEDKVEDQLKEHPYGYNLTFDENTTDKVSNMPQIYPIYTTQKIHTFKMAEYATPSRTNYTFGGWKTSPTGTATVGETYTMTGTQDDTVDATLYAHWIPVDYTISYDLAGGNVSTDNPTTYNIESEPITLINPTRENYTFKGWTGTNLSVATPNVTIPTGSTGNRSYTAVWEENTATLTYEMVGPEGESDFGSLTANSETLNVVTGSAVGSTASASYGYRFIGWYSDSSCTDLLSSDTNYTPTKSTSEVWSNKTYYAKFDYGYADLTITSSCNDADQQFIITVKNEGDTVTGEDIDLTVVLNGTDSLTVKNLPLGKYMVSETTGWAWRYENKTKQIELSATTSNSVDFLYSNKNTLTWLSGDSYCKNWWGGTGETKINKREEHY